MTFWVYENVPTNHVTVHDGSCAMCNDGVGRRVSKYPSQSIWHGPFSSEAEAAAFADSTGRPANSHRCCANPSSGASQSYVRFMLPVVDETILSLDELFHHRMLQIYVNLRDSELKYSATRFLRSVKSHGGVEHAKRSLRRSADYQSGLQRLREAGLLDQTMEHQVALDQFEPLFTPSEIWEAKLRLKDA